MSQSKCLIHQSACGRIAGEPVCPKCGLIEGELYVSEEACLLAASKAEAQFWKNESNEILAQEERLKRDALKKRKAEEAQRRAEDERLEIERGKAEEAKRQAAKARQEMEQGRKDEDARRQAEIVRLEQEEVQRLAAEQAQTEALERQQKDVESKKESHNGWLRPTSIVALVLVVGGTNVYRKMEQRDEEEQAKFSESFAIQALEKSMADPRGSEASTRAALGFGSDCTDCPEILVVPGGSFQMGGNDSDARGNGKPVRSVNVKTFAIGKYEVTQGQWRAIMGSNPSYFPNCGDNCPVETVSWNDVQSYIQKLNQKTGQQFRLPSEAEWEYACRGGQQHTYCGSNDVNSVAWYRVNTTHPVGQKTPNAFGLYDMSGNVLEWTEDVYHDSYRGAPSDGSAWVTGGEQEYRVLRGGSWLNDAWNARSAYRRVVSPFLRDIDFGFRLAMTVP